MDRRIPFRTMKNAIIIGWALPIMLAFSLASCAFQPLTLPPVCASFTASYWAEFNFDSDSPADLASTVSRLWGISQGSVIVFADRFGKPRAAVWSYLEPNGAMIVYRAWFRDGTLRKIDVEWREPPSLSPELTKGVMPKPTLSQAIDCLGAPDYYLAFLEWAPEALGATLDLLYSQQGFVVRYGPRYSHSFDLELLPGILPHLHVEQLAVVAPGSPEQMVPALYRIGNVAGGNVKNACLSEPWPGSFEELEFVLGYGFEKGEDSCESFTLEFILSVLSGTPVP